MLGRIFGDEAEARRGFFLLFLVGAFQPRSHGRAFVRYRGERLTKRTAGPELSAALREAKRGTE